MKELTRAALRFVLIALAVVIRGPTLHADPGVEAGVEPYEQAVQGFFNEQASAAELRSRLARSRALFDSIGDRCLRLYWLGRVDYLHGLIERGESNDRTAERLFESSRDLAGESAACRQTSDALRLEADSLAQLMGYRGVLYAMSMGRRVMELAEEAYDMDPDNARAAMTLALSYLHAPAFAGGSTERAIELLETVSSRRDLSTVERFSACLWLGVAYREAGRTEAAESSFDCAQQIYPGNTWVEDIRSQ